MEDKAEHEIAAGRRRIIERPRLTRLLDETPARVIMLVAPAGYGKTTLARQWVADRPHAWYQGGPSSPDVAALSLGLAEASEALVSDVGRRLREWLPTSRAPEDEVHVIEQFLADDLADLPDDAWFVVDDYHLLTSAAAEDLIRRLFVSGNRRLLLTSRQRPAWASARALLYGSFFELGQNALAMNMEEANAVLASRHAEAARGLFALADGWPAVIGLAALTPTTIKLDEEFPDELYDYFAEELFASLPEDIQDGICRLALVPVLDRVAAEAILGPGAERVVTVAREAGMFTVQRAQELAFHPLLRTFVLHKLVEMPRPEVREAVTRGTEHLIGVESWDEAFSLISEFERHELLDSLLCRAIIPLTKQGRLATLRHWLDFARLHEMASPYLDLADAELSFRQGLYDRAEMLAQSAARGMTPSAVSSQLPTTELAKAASSWTKCRAPWTTFARLAKRPKVHLTRAMHCGANSRRPSNSKDQTPPTGFRSSRLSLPTIETRLCGPPRVAYLWQCALGASPALCQMLLRRSGSYARRRILLSVHPSGTSTPQVSRSRARTQKR